MGSSHRGVERLSVVAAETNRILTGEVSTPDNLIIFCGANKWADPTRGSSVHSNAHDRTRLCHAAARRHANVGMRKPAEPSQMAVQIAVQITLTSLQRALEERQKHARIC